MSTVFARPSRGKQMRRTTKRWAPKPCRSNKVAYRTMDEAYSFIRQSKNDPQCIDDGLSLTKAYHCPWCTQYHVTSQTSNGA